MATKYRVVAGDTLCALALRSTETQACTRSSRSPTAFPTPTSSGSVIYC